MITAIFEVVRVESDDENHWKVSLKPLDVDGLDQINKATPFIPLSWLQLTETLMQVHGLNDLSALTAGSYVNISLTPQKVVVPRHGGRLKIGPSTIRPVGYARVTPAEIYDLALPEPLCIVQAIGFVASAHWVHSSGDHSLARCELFFPTTTEAFEEFIRPIFSPDPEESEETVIAWLLDLLIKCQE